MGAAEKLYIVPQPKKCSFSGRWLPCDGIRNIPQFLRKEFSIPEGGFVIEEADRKGTGIEIRRNTIKIWGDRHVCLSTLCQLLAQRPGYLPQISITEQFHFSFRGYHLDIARGGVPTLDYFKKLLKLLFLCKYNYFAIYFEDLFPWKRYPRIGKGRGRLTRGELRQVIEYGRHLGIEVFPSLELAGHMEQILMLPGFRKFSEWWPREGCLNLHDKEARRFAYGLLEDAVSFFSEARYIHIGGDETWVLGRGKSLDSTREFKGPELYESHHREMINIVRQAKKKPMIWGDMLTGMYLEEKRRKRWKRILKSPIWDRAVIASWSYSDIAKEEYRRKVRLFSSPRQVVAPGLSNWNRFYPDFQLALTNLKLFLQVAREEGVPGFLLTSWGDDGAECLYASVEPLILAAMEMAQGNTKWEDKWRVLSGESEGVVNLRKALGHAGVGSGIKGLMFDDLAPDAGTVRHWKKLRRAARGIELPGGLQFICHFIDVGLKKLDERLKMGDVRQLAREYKRLWLSERRPANLDNVLLKFTLLHFV